MEIALVSIFSGHLLRELNCTKIVCGEAIDMGLYWSYRELLFSLFSDGNLCLRFCFKCLFTNAASEHLHTTNYASFKTWFPPEFLLNSALINVTKAIFSCL